MGRSPCCSKEGLNRGAWTAHEDKVLRDYITVHGEGRWRNLPKRAGLKRCGKSCRLRWLNYLRPDIKRGNITPDEEELIVRLHKLLGNRWSLIAGRLPGRTDNEIKNYWNTNLGKKVKDNHHRQNGVASSRRLSVQPNNETAKPKAASPSSPNSKLRDSLSHVVRTKATKCSKVFISPLPPSSRQFQKQRSETEQPLLPPAAAAAAANDSTSPQTAELNGVYDSNGILSFGGGKEKEMLSSTTASDLLVDFNVGELCLSDLLNSDFSEMCDFSTYSNNNSVDGLSPSSDQPFAFSDEILNDWTQSNAAETNVANNLHSFTSFLESSEEWLGE